LETVSAASAHLGQELEGKWVLLVADYAWRPEDVTAQDRASLPDKTVRIEVGAMTAHEAIQMIAENLTSGAEAELELQVLSAHPGLTPIRLIGRLPE